MSLDALLAEIAAAVRGRHLGKARAVGPHAVAFAVSGRRELRLWCDAGRETAGLYLLTPGEMRRLEGRPPSGGSRQAILVFRKLLEGTRVAGVHRVPGERAIVAETAAGVLSLRLAGSPALTLAVNGEAVATIGDGAPAWPPAAPAPEREWDRVDPVALEAAAGSRSGREATRAVLAVCPGLGPLLARVVAERPSAFAEVRDRLRSPAPTVVVAGQLDAHSDAELARSPAWVAPFAVERPGMATSVVRSWREAWARVLEARRRGADFRDRQAAALAAARRGRRRLEQLEAALSADIADLPDATVLRRSAEALLAMPPQALAGLTEADVPDPYEPQKVLHVALDAGLSAPANADRLFHKARRVERARVLAGERLSQARSAVLAARAREEAALAARELAQLEPIDAGERPGRPAASAPAPRRYLTSSGLTLLVGRNARENHHLTFAVARPEDLWLHAREVPGSHVVVRDPERRARPQDVREAAEVAAFFSDARSQPRVDVHVARRKHVRAAGGGPGRVLVGHSETVRVSPRDPEGRLRRR